MRLTFRSSATALFALVVATACAKSAPETSPAPQAEPAVAAAAEGASVCAPKGYITENIETRFGDLFTSKDPKSESRRKGMKITRLKFTRVSTLNDDATCARAVHALASREPAAAAALGGARGGRRRAAKATDPSTRPVKPAVGGVLAIVKIGPYYVVQDAAQRPNQAQGVATYVLDGGMKVRGVFR
jgi:hypothetical protein